jgi:hypothetical protein
VSSINPAAKEITITSRSLMGASQAVIVAVTDKATMKRYSADSIPKYSEAKPGKFEDVKVGDQLHARGDKNADATRLTAEEIVSGTFRIAGGTVTAIDVAANKISMNDLQTKKPMTVVVRPDSVLRRFVQMMGGGAAGGSGAPGQGGPGAQGAGTQGAGRPAPGAQGAGAQGPGGQGPRPGGPGGPGMNMADLLERLPVISINELKVGDTVIMSTLPGSDPSQVTAISLVTGIEPLLQMIAMRQQAGGQPRPQNVDLNSNFGGMFGGIGP